MQTMQTMFDHFQEARSAAQIRARGGHMMAVLRTADGRYEATSKLDVEMRRLTAHIVYLTDGSDR